MPPLVLPELALPAPRLRLLELPTPVRLVSLAFPIGAPTFEFPEPPSLIPALVLAPPALLLAVPVFVLAGVPVADAPDVPVVLAFALLALGVFIFSEAPHALKKTVAAHKMNRPNVRLMTFPPCTII